jgi:hypothetical protein
VREVARRSRRGGARSVPGRALLAVALIAAAASVPAAGAAEATRFIPWAESPPVAVVL